MAKLLKHLGLGVKKSSHQISTSRSECNNSTQKSSSVHELLPKSPSRYQSSVCLPSGAPPGGNNGGGGTPPAPVPNANIPSTRSEYDTRSLKLNLEGGKQHQYQSLQKCAIGGPSRGKSDGLTSPGKNSNVGSVDSPAGTSSIDSPIIPKIVDEYCDPLDLAETSSLLIDDDYSVPYDEVNKVLKDIQTNKADKILNGLSGHIISVDKSATSDGHHLAKVPLKLTSTSQITSLHIKQRKPKERREDGGVKTEDTKYNQGNTMELSGNKSGVETKTHENVEDEPQKGQIPSHNDIATICSTNHVVTKLSPSTNLFSPSSDAANKDKLPGQLCSSDSTSGGCVIVVSTNHFQDFEPIDCGHVLTSFAAGQGQKPGPPGATPLAFRCDSNGPMQADESADMNSTLFSTVISSKADQSSQTPPTNCNKPVESEKSNQSGRDMQIRSSSESSKKSRPKSDGFLLLPLKDSKKFIRHKHVHNGCKGHDAKVTKDSKSFECQCKNHGNGCQATLDHHKTPRRESRNCGLPDSALSGPIKSSTRISLNLPLERQSWFHGSIGRVDAEKLLEGNTEGTFLVRISESNNEDFSLSLKSSAGFLHIKIVRQGMEEGHGKFILGQFSQPFDSVASMVQFYCLNRLPVKGNEALSLMHPLQLNGF